MPFDFGSRLAVGETLSSAVVTIQGVSGSDSAAPTLAKSGSAAVSGTIASQLVTGGTAGSIYNVVCLGTTSAQVLSLSGYVTVLAEPV